MSSQPEQNTPESATPVAQITPAKVPADQANSPRQETARPNGKNQEQESNAAGLASFIGGILKPDANQQHADQGMGERIKNWHKDAKTQDGKPKAAGLFDAMDAPLRGLGPEDLRFANEVDAALSRRPRFGARLLSLTVAGMLLLLVIWAGFADVDEVTHADGQVVGSQRTQTIQNLEGGIVRNIQVREGQIVEKGAVLAQLDNEVAESSFRDAVSKAVENSLALVRLEAELNEKKPVFPDDLRRWLTGRLGIDIDAKTLARARQILRDQENAFRSRSELYAHEVDALQALHAQKVHDVEEQEARLEQTNKSLEIARQQRDTGAELLRRKNFARMEYLSLEQKVVELQGQVAQLVSGIPRARAAAAEALQRVFSRQAEQRANISQEISKRRIELTSLRETLSAGGDRVTRTELRAPVRGTVRQIYVNTLGGVVKPGEPIMDLVPLDDTLLVEARVSPKDVAFLRPGQDVVVKVTAYDFSIYGGLDAKLESISADTIEDKRGDPHYLVKVRTQENAITHNNETLPIIPGMMVTADILIGKKTVLDYMLKPILKAKQNALRER